MWNSWEHFIGNYAMKLWLLFLAIALNYHAVKLCVVILNLHLLKDRISSEPPTIPLFTISFFIYLPNILFSGALWHFSCLYRFVIYLRNTVRFCPRYLSISLLNTKVIYRNLKLVLRKTILTCTVFYCAACWVRVWRLNLWLCQFEWINGIAGRRWNVFSQQFMAEAFSSIIIWNWILTDIL